MRSDPSHALPEKGREDPEQFKAVPSSLTLDLATRSLDQGVGYIQPTI